MATTIAQIESLARLRLEEPVARFWSSAEITGIIIAGIKDLWRDIVNLKAEHFLTIDESNVTLAANSSALAGLPSDVHKVYLIEPLDSSGDSDNSGLIFQPLDYNHPTFMGARAMDAVDPMNQTIYYAIMAAGSPVGAPTIKIAPQVTSSVTLRFVYVPTVSGSLVSASDVPIPGDADNALVAWAVAYARAKEREDRAPDPLWLATYKGEKDRIVNSLGLRQLQEPLFVDAVFEDFS